MTGSPDPSPVDLLTVGETMVLIAPPAGGEIAYGAEVVLGTAGAESNVAIGGALLGMRTAWHSRVGAGPLGDVVLAGVSNRGVEVSSVVVDPTRPTGLVVKSRVDGTSRIDYYRAGSAASALSVDDLGILPPARAIHTSGVAAALSPSARALVAELLDRPPGGALTSFDVNYRPVLWPSREVAASELLALARRADVVFVGRDEAELLWGTATADEVRALLPSPRHLVVKDADVEAVEFDADTRVAVLSHRVEVVDAVGAGDAFAAGWWAASLGGSAAAERLARGHALAAAALASPTDQPEIVPGDAVQEGP